MSGNLKLGAEAESMAASYLRHQGYVILEKNYRSKFGEIDLIAKDKNTLVFIEVKARRSGSFGHPKEAVNRVKQKKISMVALAYMRVKRAMNMPVRFDVVAICSQKGNVGIEIVKNAFEFACR